MHKGKIVTGVDIGSSKVAIIVASVNPEEKVSVIGVSSVPSRGIKKGVVVDIDEAVGAIAEGLEAAERMAGYAVSSAFVTVDGKHISSLNSHGVVAVSDAGSEITENDVDRVTEAARAISIPSSREIIHVLPRGFIVDSQDGVKDPVGMSGVRLEVETNIISGSATVMRNLVKCVQQVGVDVEDLVFCGLAASEAVLSDTEKELGTVLVDLGGGTTQIVIFAAGSPIYSASLPIGGQNITNDLAVGLRTSLENAEKIKIRLSEEKSAGGKEKGKDDEIDVSDLGLEIKSVPRSLVQSIIEARLTEIFHMVGLEIKSSGQQGSLPAGLVITGGGASTLGVKEVAKKVLRMPLRIGYPTGATGLIDEVSSPAFASSIGLVVYGSYLEPEGMRLSPLMGAHKVSKVLEKAVKWVKSFLP